jgi:SagB-type dehydrogenase family enzyme
VFEPERNGISRSLFRGSQQLIFKIRSTSDRTFEYGRAPPLWSLYVANARRQRGLRLPQRAIVDRFVGEQGVRELVEIGHVQVQPRRRVSLPPARRLERPFSEVLVRRRTERALGRRWTAVDLATLLHYAYGSHRKSAVGKRFRTYPSPGALYPTDVQIAVRSVVGVPSGLYAFDANSNSLILVAQDTRAMLKAFHETKGLASARVVILLVSRPFRTFLKYGDVGYKFSVIDAGVVLENFVLTATALGKRTFPYESYYDDELNRALGLDGSSEFVATTLLLG